MVTMRGSLNDTAVLGTSIDNEVDAFNGGVHNGVFRLLLIMFECYRGGTTMIDH